MRACEQRLEQAKLKADTERVENERYRQRLVMAGAKGGDSKALSEEAEAARRAIEEKRLADNKAADEALARETAEHKARVAEARAKGRDEKVSPRHAHLRRSLGRKEAAQPGIDRQPLTQLNKQSNPRTLWLAHTGPEHKTEVVYHKTQQTISMADTHTHTHTQALSEEMEAARREIERLRLESNKRRDDELAAETAEIKRKVTEAGSKGRDSKSLSAETEQARADIEKKVCA